MEISYKRKYDESFMIIETTDERQSYENRMIEENDIKNLLSFSQIRCDNVTANWYKISKLESLEEFLEGEDFSLAFFEKFIIYLHLAMEEIGKYLIDINHIYLSPQTIFICPKGDGFDIKLCYFLQEQSMQEQFRIVIEHILKVLPADDKMLLQRMYEIYDICLKDEFTFLEIVEKLHEYESYAYNDKKELNVMKIDIQQEMEGLNGNDNFMNEKKVEVRDEAKVEDDFWENWEEPHESNLGATIKNFVSNIFSKRRVNKVGGDEIMEDFIVEPDIEIYEPTVLLTEQSQKCVGKLVYEGDSFEENFIINHETFRIGSKHGKNQAIINSKAVSKNHAKIIHTEDGYYLEDLNSTNGTRVNGKLINYREPYKLKPMDSILFADVAYVFM